MGAQLWPLWPADSRRCPLRRERVREMRGCDCLRRSTASPCRSLFLAVTREDSWKLQNTGTFFFFYSEMIIMGIVFTFCNFLPPLIFSALWPLTLIRNGKITGCFLKKLNAMKLWYLSREWLFKNCPIKVISNYEALFDHTKGKESLSFYKIQA